MHSLLSQRWKRNRTLLSNLRLRSPYLCPPVGRVALLYARTLGSLFLASYDSQGYGSGIKSQRYLTTEGQSVSLSWYQATFWDPRLIFLSLPWKVLSDICGFPLVVSLVEVFYPAPR